MRLAAGVRARGDAARGGRIAASVPRASSGTSTSTGRNLHDNASHLREYFWSARLLEWAPIAGTVGVARRSPPLAGLLATWFGVFLLVKGTTPLSTVSSGSFFRFVMPGFPAYFLLGVSILLLVPTLGASLARASPEGPARALDRRLVLGLAIVLAYCRWSSSRSSGRWGCLRRRSSLTRS